jgi:photosystem II stability/assembly factor-like uncharacterized protein
MLTGRVPFHGETPAEISGEQIRSSPPSPSTIRTDIPAPLSQVLLTCLQLNPSHRYQTPQDLLQDLTAGHVRETREVSSALRETTETVVRKGAPTPVQQTPRPKTSLVLPLIALALVVLIPLTIILIRGAKSGPTVAVAATLTVTSSPPGAQVFLDGTSIGTTPITNKTVNPGTHVLRLTLSGYKDMLEAIELEESQQLSKEYSFDIQNGTAWKAINVGLTYNRVTFVAVDPTDADVVYAGTGSDGNLASDSGVFKSTDKGRHWQLISKPFSLVYALAFDPSNARRLYVTGWLGYVLKSEDSGKTWTSLETGDYPAVLSIAVDPKTPRAMYVGTTYGIWKSKDGAKTFHKCGLDSPGYFCLAIDASNTNVVFAGSEAGGLFRSMDGGDSWNEVVNFGSSCNAIEIDYGHTQTMYAGTWGGGVLKSADGGSSWSAINNGLTNLNIRSIALDPTSPDVVYVGTWGGGVFRSTDAGSSWSALNNGLTNLYVRSIAIDSEYTGTIYAGTWGGGVFRGDLAEPTRPPTAPAPE